MNIQELYEAAAKMQISDRPEERKYYLQRINQLIQMSSMPSRDQQLEEQSILKNVYQQSNACKHRIDDEVCSQKKLCQQDVSKIYRGIKRKRCEQENL